MRQFYAPGMTKRASGTLFGLAFGDALGAPTEFLDLATIEARYGAGGPRTLVGDPVLVTDDTQLAIAVADALLDAGDPLTAATLEAPLTARYLAWWASPENNRAPGKTCLDACAALNAGEPWLRATRESSKGCGANMRVAPVGLVPGLTDAQRAGAAQFQAALTHGHPTGLAASELTAYAVHLLRGSLAPADLPAALRERAHAQRTTYHHDWLGALWRQPGVTSPEGFIARGWEECLAALDTLDVALVGGDRNADPCLVTGEGWVAEEALACGLLCFLLFPDDPVAALARGAASSGDSDSIASLAGAFAGAAYGVEAWPAEWFGRIEYRADLARIAAHWD